MNKKIYIVWVGGIGVSAIARYYLHLGWDVFWSDATATTLTNALEKEWLSFTLWSNELLIDESFDLLVYSEAVPVTQSEISRAMTLWIKTHSYPQALADIVNHKKLIAIAGTHGKSTTTSLTSLVLKDSQVGVNAIVGTLLKEFDGKNTHFSESENFVIEACEYKRSFLHYKPVVWVITNIELDHLDYYRDNEDYLSAFDSFVNNILPGWFLILNGDDVNCRQLIWRRDDISYIEVFQEVFLHNGQVSLYPNIDIQIPWDHILFDAKISYIIGHMLWLLDEEILQKLSVYNGVWRRMERIWQTVNNNILMSDYWHHPTEVSLTLESIRQKYSDKKVVVIFQPHQYNRTIELLDWFKTAFQSSDILVVPNIYESRDSEQDKKDMSPEILLGYIEHSHKIFWEGLVKTADWIKHYDIENPDSSIIILLGAWDVDNLRFEIEMK